MVLAERTLLVTRGTSPGEHFYGCSTRAERSTEPEFSPEGAHGHPRCVEHPWACWLLTESAGGQAAGTELILQSVAAVMDGLIPKTPGPVLHNQSHSLCLSLSHARSCAFDSRSQIPLKSLPAGDPACGVSEQVGRQIDEEVWLDEWPVDSGTILQVADNHSIHVVILFSSNYAIKTIENRSFMHAILKICK